MSFTSDIRVFYRCVSIFGVVLRTIYIFFFQAEDGIRDKLVTGVQTCALPISAVTIPVSSSFGNPRIGVEARISVSTAGAILQPQPPPWLNSVRRIFSGAFMGL